MNPLARRELGRGDGPRQVEPLPRGTPTGSACRVEPFDSRGEHEGPDDSTRDEAPPVLGAANLRAKVDDARKLARAFFWRMQLPPLAVGCALCAASISAPVALLARGKVAPMGAVFISLAFWPAGTSILLFACSPPMARTLVLGMQGVAALLTAIFAYPMHGLAVELTRARGEAPCVLRGRSVTCSIVHATICSSLLLIVGSAYLVFSLGACLCVGTRPREILRVSAIANGRAALMYTLALVILVVVGSHHDLKHISPPAERASLIIALCSCFSLAALLLIFQQTHERVQDMIVSRGSRNGQVAANIAALMQGREPAEVHSLAVAHFRAVRAVDVTLDALRASSSARSASATADLRQLTVRATAGRVDAFVSHSWLDNAQAKIEALQAWRAHFVAAHRREPYVWLDKYCIDQDDIEVGLACLPLFLSGCDKLLILAGPTWLSRLWCIVEVSVWAQMQGMGRDWYTGIEVVPLSHAPARSSACLSHASCERTSRSRQSAPDSVTAPDSGTLPSATRRSSAPRASASGRQISPTLRVARFAASFVAATSSSPAFSARLSSGRRRESMRPYSSRVSPGSADDCESASGSRGVSATFGEQLEHFDVRDASTSLETDYVKLIAVVEATSMSLDGFNKAVRDGLRAATVRTDAMLAAPPPAHATLGALGKAQLPNVSQLGHTWLGAEISAWPRRMSSRGVTPTMARRLALSAPVVLTSASTGASPVPPARCVAAADTPVAQSRVWGAALPRGPRWRGEAAVTPVAPLPFDALAAPSPVASATAPPPPAVPIIALEPIDDARPVVPPR